MSMLFLAGLTCARMDKTKLPSAGDARFVRPAC
jgi:hypothetical protein